MYDQPVHTSAQEAEALYFCEGWPQGARAEAKRQKTLRKGTERTGRMSETEARFHEENRRLRDVARAAEHVLERHPELMNGPAGGALRREIAGYREAEYRAQKEATR